MLWPHGGNITSYKNGIPSIRQTVAYLLVEQTFEQTIEVMIVFTQRMLSPTLTLLLALIWSPPTPEKNYLPLLLLNVPPDS